MDTRDGVKVTLPTGWFLVRGSNTEPIVRVVAEGASEAEARGVVKDVFDRVAQGRQRLKRGTILSRPRVVEPEMMDQPDLDVRRHVHALDALGRANAVSRTAAAVWPSIRAVSHGTVESPLRVLDIACGGGHVLLSLARRAARARMDVDWLGWDMSPVAIDYARTLAGRRGVEGVRFELADALRDPIPAGIDVVLCTLFLHHLTETDAVALLRRMREAARAQRWSSRISVGRAWAPHSPGPGAVRSRGPRSSAWTACDRSRRRSRRTRPGIWRRRQG